MAQSQRVKAFAVFQGGGVRGIALAGALASTYDDFDYVRVAGTSAGAIVASLFAAGYEPQDMYEILRKPEFPRVLLDGGWMNARKGFLHRGDKFYTFIRELLHAKCGKGLSQEVTFRDMARPLKIVASDLTHRKPLLFPDDASENMEVAMAVRMSMSIPFFFKPVEWGRSLVVDGGVISNFPVWIFRKERDAGMHHPVIGFRLQGTEQEPHPPNGQMEMFTAMFDTMMNALDIVATERLEQDLFIVRIPTGLVKTTDFGITPETKEQLFKWGQEAGLGFLDSWRSGRVVGGAPFYRRFFEHSVELAQGLYSASRTEVRLAEVKQTYHINEDYSASEYREYTVAADSEPVRAMQIVIGAATAAQFDELGMELSSLTNEKVYLLPYLDSPNEKRILAVFLPEIQPGHTRSFAFRCTWPGAWMPLKESGQDTLTVAPYEYGRTEGFTLRLVYRGPKDHIRCLPVVHRGSFNETPQVLDDDHFYYEWTDTQVPGGTEYTLRINE